MGDSDGVGRLASVATAVLMAGCVAASSGGSATAVDAAGERRNIAESAASPTWELRPGATIQWQVQVDRPAAAAFRGWNPYCEPMIEG